MSPSGVSVPSMGPSSFASMFANFFFYLVLEENWNSCLFMCHNAAFLPQCHWPASNTPTARLYSASLPYLPLIHQQLASTLPACIYTAGLPICRWPASKPLNCLYAARLPLYHQPASTLLACHFLAHLALCHHWPASSSVIVAVIVIITVAVMVIIIVIVCFKSLRSISSHGQPLQCWISFQGGGEYAAPF